MREERSLVQQYDQAITQLKDQPSGTWLEYSTICTKPKLVSIDLLGASSIEEYSSRNESTFDKEWMEVVEVDPPQLLDLDWTAGMIYYPSGCFRSLPSVDPSLPQENPQQLRLTISGLDLLDPDDGSENLGASTAQAVVFAIVVRYASLDSSPGRLRKI